jgi:hypothetical protein
MSDRYNPTSKQNSNMDLRNADALHAMYNATANMANAENSYQRNFFPRAGQGMTGQQGTAGMQNAALKNYNNDWFRLPLHYDKQANSIETLRDILNVLATGGKEQPRNTDFDLPLRTAITGASAFSGLGGLGETLYKAGDFGFRNATQHPMIEKAFQVASEKFGSFPKGSGRLPIDKSQKLSGASQGLSDFITSKGYKMDELTKRMLEYLIWKKPIE